MFQKTLGGLTLAAMLMLVPLSAAQLADDTAATVNDISTFLVRGTSSVTSGTFAGSGQDVFTNDNPFTYEFDIWAFDRNGESDQTARAWALYAPDTGASGAAQTTTPASTSDGVTASAPDWNVAATLQGSGVISGDATPNNGVSNAVVTLNFAAGAAPGVWTFEVYDAAGIGGAPAATGTIVVYEVLSIVAQNVNGGGTALTNGEEALAGGRAIDFGAVDPINAAVDASSGLLVSNANGASVTVGMAVTALTNGGNSIPANLVLFAASADQAGTTAAVGTPAPPSATAGAVADANTFTIAGNSHKVVGFALDLSSGSGSSNSILQDAAYAGTLTLSVAGGGAGYYSYDGSSYTPGGASPSNGNASSGTFYADQTNPDGLGLITIA